MNARVIACYNLKGGVGKSTAAVNLSYAAAAAGRQVLLWDLDPQAAASFYFRVKPKIRGGAKQLIKSRRKLQDFIKATNYPGLELMPADFSYRNLDQYLGRKRRWAGRLAELVAPVRNEYDFIFLDCPPAISIVSENIFLAADVLLIPLIPTFLSLRVYERLKDWFGKHPEFEARLLPFFSMVDRRRRLHRDIMAGVVRDHPEVLDASISYSAVVERMGHFRAPLQVFAPCSETSASFTALWREVHDRIGPEEGEKGGIPDGNRPV